MDPIFRPTSEYASFVHRLDYLLQQAADQQCNYRTGDNLRIQSHSSGKVPGLESQMMLIAHDAVPEPALSSKKYDSPCLPCICKNCQSLQRSSVVLLIIMMCFLLSLTTLLMIQDKTNEKHKLLPTRALSSLQRVLLMTGSLVTRTCLHQIALPLPRHSISSIYLPRNENVSI
ncbi:hypothetical protein BC826DRAFT_738446 [Russula brevipes]|nr:hypothetical protein BC826DRAFT_738446 [Russula brevipes]